MPGVETVQVQLGRSEAVSIPCRKGDTTARGSGEVIGRRVDYRATMDKPPHAYFNQDAVKPLGPSTSATVPFASCR